MERTKSCCSRIFNYAEIRLEGNINLCCPNYLKESILGNIYTDNFEELWNGEKIRTLRKKLLSGNYESCNLEFCNIRNDVDSSDFNEIMPPPQFITYGTSNICNFKCKMCPVKIKNKYHSLLINNSENLLTPRFVKYVLPILTNCKDFRMAPNGEVFYSKHYYDVIRIVRDTYPNINFSFHTNGSLCTEKVLNTLKIENRLNNVCISLHSITKETHRKITGTDTFDKIITNIYYLLKLKQLDLLQTIGLYFVIQADNYKELPAFLEFCEKFKLCPGIWSIYNCKNLDVSLETHPLHQDFLKVLNTEIVKTYKYVFTEKIQKLITNME